MNGNTLSSRNCFASPSLDRISCKRRNDSWIAERLADAHTCFIPIWQSKNLFTEDEVPRPVLLSFRDMGDLLPQAESPVLLGEKDGKAYFAVDLPSGDASSPFSDRGRFRDLKTVGALLGHREASLLAYARAITYWHHRNRFCGDCGSPARSAEGGHMRVCTNERCGQQRFPRTDPAIIVLVASGNQCLLGRQAVWPPSMYSTLAGFVEPGESLESAVIREVGEETGIKIGEVRYHSSQPWPFPCSLMLGFTAPASSRDIRLADNELEDARWFSREDIRYGLKEGTLRLPSNISIAYRLIEDWFDAASSEPLRDILASV